MVLSVNPTIRRSKRLENLGNGLELYMPLVKLDIVQDCSLNTMKATWNQLPRDAVQKWSLNSFKTTVGVREIYANLAKKNVVQKMEERI
uniref:Uncharacterized protein n=1 Tax=Acrobeloides nanus TaxID=290746 RepID=A0A914DYU6_9BILA